MLPKNFTEKCGAIIEANVWVPQGAKAGEDNFAAAMSVTLVDAKALYDAEQAKKQAKKSAEEQEKVKGIIPSI